MKSLIVMLALVGCSGPSKSVAGPKPGGAGGDAAWTHARCNTVPLCQASCDKAEVGGCERLGILTVFDAGGYTPPVKHDLEAACDHGLRVCMYVALRACPPDEAEAAQSTCMPEATGRLEQGCKAGDPEACRALSRATEQGAPGVAADPARAKQLLNDALSGLERACDAGDPNGCAEAADLLSAGDGVAHDDAAAHKLAVRGVAGYHQLCGVGDALGCYFEALATKNGRGVAADLDQAKKILAQACLLGLPMPALCSTLGGPPPG